MLQMRITESNYLNHFIKASTITFAGAGYSTDKYLVLDCLGQREPPGAEGHYCRTVRKQLQIYSLYLNSLNDNAKTANITPALTRNARPPNASYNNPPVVNPIILATPVTLPATPCTAPW